jgi:hypothetical protein
MRRVLDSTTGDLILLAASLILLLLLTPFGIESDGATRFDGLSRLLSFGYLSHNPYSLVGPIASAPLWWIGRPHGASEWWCARFNFLVFAFGLLGLYRALAPHIDRRIVVRFLLLLTLASMFPHHDARYFGEVFTAVLAATGLAFVVVAGQGWGWLLVVIGCANTPASLVALALVSTWWAARRRDPRHLLPIAAGAALVLGEAWLRRGSPFASGYEASRGVETILPYSGRPGFSYPIVFGILSILFSFGKGLLFFSPGLLTVGAPAPRPQRTLLTTWLLFLAGLVLAYAKWWGWNGGDFFGPRFFLFASIPAAFGLAAWTVGPRQRIAIEALAMTALAASLWVGLDGLVFAWATPDVCTANHYAQEYLCWYTPEYSALFRPFIVPVGLGRDERILVGLFVVAAAYLLASRVIRAASEGIRPGKVYAGSNDPAYR